MANLDIAELIKMLQQMQANGGPTQPVTPLPSAPVGDYYLLPATPGPDGVGGAMFRHKYDIQRPNRTVATPFDADWPELYRANPFVYAGLSQQRRELGAFLRWAGVASQPAWFDAVLSAAVFNAGIDRETERLRGVIGELEARRA